MYCQNELITLKTCTMNFILSSNEILIRLSSAVSYRLGMNNQLFTYFQVAKLTLDLEDLYTREELEFMCQADNIEALHEAVSALIN